MDGWERPAGNLAKHLGESERAEDRTGTQDSTTTAIIADNGARPRFCGQSNAAFLFKEKKKRLSRAIEGAYG